MLIVFTLNVFMLSVLRLSVFMLSVYMQNVFMLKAVYAECCVALHFSNFNFVTFSIFRSQKDSFSINYLKRFSMKRISLKRKRKLLSFCIIIISHEWV